MHIKPNRARPDWDQTNSKFSWHINISHQNEGEHNEIIANYRKFNIYHRNLIRNVFHRCRERAKMCWKLIVRDRFLMSLRTFPKLRTVKVTRDHPTIMETSTNRIFRKFMYLLSNMKDQNFYPSIDRVALWVQNLYWDFDNNPTWFTSRNNFYFLFFVFDQFFVIFIFSFLFYLSIISTCSFSLFHMRKL